MERSGTKAQIKATLLHGFLDDDDRQRFVWDAFLQKKAASRSSGAMGTMGFAASSSRLRPAVSAPAPISKRKSRSKEERLIARDGNYLTPV